jgi:hypothetical protein
MAIMTSEMMTSRSLICLLENQNRGKLQKYKFPELYYQMEILVYLINESNENCMIRSGLFLGNVPTNVRPLFSSSTDKVKEVNQLSTVTLRLVL